jgi:hypothetical protein
MRKIAHRTKSGSKRDIPAALDLVQIVGATTSLKKAGRSWKGLCPFHDEVIPSFHVSPNKSFYFCFGCGAKGDAVGFIRALAEEGKKVRALARARQAIGAAGGDPEALDEKVLDLVARVLDRSAEEGRQFESEHGHPRNVACDCDPDEAGSF